MPSPRKEICAELAAEGHVGADILRFLERDMDVREMLFPLHSATDRHELISVKYRHTTRRDPESVSRNYMNYTTVQISRDFAKPESKNLARTIANSIIGYAESRKIQIRERISEF